LDLLDSGELRGLSAKSPSSSFRQSGQGKPGAAAAASAGSAPALHGARARHARGGGLYRCAAPRVPGAHAEPLAAAAVPAAQAKFVAFGPDGLRVGRGRASGRRREAQSGLRTRPSEIG
jgi:hypothetical protein